MSPCRSLVLVAGSACSKGREFHPYAVVPPHKVVITSALGVVGRYQDDQAAAETLDISRLRKVCGTGVQIRLTESHALETYLNRRQSNGVAYPIAA